MQAQFARSIPRSIDGTQQRVDVTGQASNQSNQTNPLVLATAAIDARMSAIDAKPAQFIPRAGGKPQPGPTTYSIGGRHGHAEGADTTE